MATTTEPASDRPATPDGVAPVSAKDGQRLASLDFIRGIAVLGILAANIVAFGQPFAAYMYPAAFTVPHSAAEDWMWVGQFVLIDNKMRGLFTILFGAGMMLFMEKAWARGASRWLQARRLAWLGLFGLIHYFLIWRGDILFSYAACGLLALLLVRVSAKWQLRLGLMGYVTGALLWGGMMSMMVLAADTDLGAPGQPMAEFAAELESGKQEALADGALQTELISEGRYGDFVAHMFGEHAGDLAFFIFLWMFETLPLMLIGMALYQFGFSAAGSIPAR